MLEHGEQQRVQKNLHHRKRNKQDNHELLRHQDHVEQKLTGRRPDTTGVVDFSVRFFVGELADHLPPGAVLDKQRVFAADLRAPRYVRQLDEQACRAAFDERHVAVDDAFVRLDLVRAQAQLVGVMIARCTDAAEDVAQFGVVGVDLDRQAFDVFADHLVRHKLKFLTFKSYLAAVIIRAIDGPRQLGFACTH